MRKPELILLLCLFLAACSQGVPSIPSLTGTATAASAITASPTAAMTATLTATLTETPTPTITLTPSITPTPTFALPEGVVKVAQAFCRYGPGKAYLPANDLVQGDRVIIGGKDATGAWLFVKPDFIDRYCWSAASNFEISGDLRTVIVQETHLPKSGFVNPPTGVSAVRTGNQVNITWDAANYIPVGDRRGYLLELTICQNGAYFFSAWHTDGTSFTIQDDAGCSAPSSGLLYIAEKHGYSEPVSIPWP
ncbi:MAG: hypothetical protein HYZ26_10250 [Chloroflexi bacterium]|nr:hypothetical protein [Chloroflexota bacterium]